MKVQKFIITTIIALLAVVTPVSADNNKKEVLSNSSIESTETVITASNSSVRVQNANGKYMYIYSLTGEQKGQVKIDSNDKTISLSLPRCIYIMKIGEVARKVAIK